VQGITDRELRTRLIAVNKSIRADRPPFSATDNVVFRRFPTLAGNPRRLGEMYQFWFRTRGCTFDRAGQCSMCNYGVGPDIDPRFIGRALRWRMAAVPDNAFIYVSPSGSLLDPREVPRELLYEVLAEVARHKPLAFAFETRPELCSAEVFAKVRSMLPGTTRVAIELGVESWTPEIRRMCHLKPSPQSAYENALRLAREYGFDMIANLTLGGLGLTDAAAYADAIASVRGTREAGFSSQIVFPLSAKEGSLVGWAHGAGLWRPPTLWMLIRLLAECAVEGEAAGHERDLDISWYNPTLDDVLHSRPDCCAACRPMVIGLLERFRLEPTAAALGPALAWRGCDCREEADRRLRPAPEDERYRGRLLEIVERSEATLRAGAGAG
jgi:radical SAM enzyme (TIGR01210 family)